MYKKSPVFTASAAAVTYFITYVILKYLLDGKVIDWKGALSVAVVFWLVIFLVHQYLEKRLLAE